MIGLFKSKPKKVEVLVHNTWKPRPFKKLRSGNIFRLFISNEVRRVDLYGRHQWIAASNPYIHRGALCIDVRITRDEIDLYDLIADINSNTYYNDTIEISEDDLQQGEL